MELIDDHPVTDYRVRFQGRATIDEGQAAHVRDANIVLWLVRTRCLPPQYHPIARDSEERYRFNIQAVQEVAPLSGAMRESAIVFLDHGHDQGYIATEPVTLPLELAVGAPRYTEQGLVDPMAEQRNLELLKDMSALRDYLQELGELSEHESITDAVRRVIETRAETGAERYLRDRRDDPVYEDAYVRARRDIAPGEVEVVGSVYGPGRTTSKTHDLLNEQFGEH